MIELQVIKRAISGKKNRSLIKNGVAPGAIGRNNEPTILVQADQKALIPLTRIYGSEIVTVVVDGKDSYKAVVSELYINPLNNKVESFTLTELTPKSHVTVSVPIMAKGISPAVKNNLGVLVENLPALKITANSENIIEKIEVDISNLVDIGSRILVSELPGIEKMKLASEKDRTLTVFTIRPLQKVEVVRPVAGAEGTTEGGETTEAAPEEAEAK